MRKLIFFLGLLILFTNSAIIGQNKTILTKDQKQQIENPIKDKIDYLAREKVGQNSATIKARHNGTKFTRVTKAVSKGIPIFEQHELVSDPGAGAGGADASELEANQTNLGEGFNQMYGISVADDFTIPAGYTWEIDGFVFYGYQTLSSTTSTITGVYARIYDGDPSAGGALIQDFWTTNIMIGTDWTNIYRVENGALTNTDRPIMKMDCAVTPFTLTEGTYWVEWAATGSLDSGPWVPHLQFTDGNTTTGNAMQNYMGDWYTMEDVGPQGFPFDILGSLADSAAPGPVLNFVVTPDAGGALNAQVNWDNPDTTYGGAPLTDLDSVVLYVDGVAEYVNTSPAIGGSESLVVTVPDNGLYFTKVVGYNDAGEGGVTIEEVWFGEDVPAAPSNVILVDSTTTTIGGDKIAAITWDAPVTGLHGGYFTGNGVTYDIFRYPDMVTVMGDWNGTQPYIDIVPGIDTYSYKIIAKNAIGVGGNSTSNSSIIGILPAVVPFETDLNTGNDYFILQAGDQATASLNNNLGVGGTKCIQMTGKYYIGWPPAGPTSYDQAYSYTSHIASASITVDATALTPGDPLKLMFDMRQEAEYQTTYSWLRVLVNGNVITNMNGDSAFNPTNLTGDPYVKQIYNLSAYSGSTITIDFEASNKLENCFVLIDNLSLSSPHDEDFDAVKIYGNTTPTVGLETMLNFVVTNLGNVAQSDYLLEIYEEGNPTPILDTSIVGNTIEPFGTDTITFYWTPAVEGALSIRGVVTLAGDTVNINDTTDYIHINVFPSGSSYVITLGNQSTLQSSYADIPFDFNWMNSLSETMYYPTEITTSGVITGINFYYNFEEDIPNTPVKVWLGETILTDLSGGYISANDLTKVFDGIVSFVSGGDQVVHIEFDQPYIYSGDNNLVMMCNRPMDSQYYSYNSKFYTTETPTATSRTVATYSDDNTIDPYNPPDPTSTLDEHPDVSFFILPEGLGSLDGVVDDGTINVDSAMVHVIGDTTGFELTTITDTAGYYMFGYLPADDYTIITTAFGYLPDTTTGVSVLEYDNTTQNITLTPLPTYTVSGYVEGNDAPGTPIEGALIVITGNENYSGYTIADGTFSIPGVYDDFGYTMTISYTGYHTFDTTFTLAGANFDVGTVILEEADGIENILISSLAIYPNPATNSVNTKSDNIIQSVTVYNFAGQVVLSETINNTTYRVNTSNFDAGIYLFQIETEEGKIGRRIIIE